MAGPVGEAGSAPGAAHDLVDPVGRERFPPPWSLQRQEDAVADCLRRPLAVQVARQGGEEPCRHRDEPLAAPLAVGDEHPPLTEADVFEAEAEHLAATQPAQHHGVDHGPVPLGAKRFHQGVDLGGTQYPGQRRLGAHERTSSRPLALSAGGEPLGHRVVGDRGAAPRQQVGVEP